MTDNFDQVLAYYDQYNDGEDSRLNRHQLERDITLRYLENYLPPDGRILEIGAATGGYTLWLAQRGYQVTAVDICETLMDRCKSRLAKAGLADRVTCRIANVLDLSAIPGSDFDAVLLMGPLYHLIEKPNRLTAIRQAALRLKPGGLFVSAFISRLGILGNLLRDIPQWIDNQSGVRSVLDDGRDAKGAHMHDFHGYYTTTEEIAPLHEEAGLQTIALAAAEPAISADDDSYNRLTGSRRQLWLDLLYGVSREPALLASSRHLLYLARKPRHEPA